jgi:hypothetical protein
MTLELLGLLFSLLFLLLKEPKNPLALRLVLSLIMLDILSIHEVLEALSGLVAGEIFQVDIPLACRSCLFDDFSSFVLELLSEFNSFLSFLFVG